MTRKNDFPTVFFSLLSASLLFLAVLILLPILICLFFIYAIFARNRLRTTFGRFRGNGFSGYSHSPSGAEDNDSVVDVDCRVIDRKELDSGSPE